MLTRDKLKTAFFWIVLIITIAAGICCKYIAGQYSWENRPHTFERDLLFWTLALVSIVGFISLWIYVKPQKTIEIDDDSKKKAKK